MRKRTKVWTKEELQWLRENAANLTLYDVAEHLHRSIQSVRSRVAYMGLSCRHRVRFSVVNGVRLEHRKWTDEEVAYVKSHAAHEALEDVAKALGRTVLGVKLKVRSLGIAHRQRRRRWTKREVARLYQYAEKHDISTIAKRLKRSRDAVNSMMCKLGIRLYAGGYSLRAAMAETGYSASQLMRARDKLGQKWRYRRPRWIARYVITEEQLNALCDYLKEETWGRRAA